MILDFILAALVLGLAIGVLGVSDLFESVILFVTLGLVLALVWVRLEAPDVALAEAAIGAGLMGVFLLDTVGLRGLRKKSKTSGKAESR